MKERYTEEKIIGFLREANAGLSIKEPCRNHGFSEPSCQASKAKFGSINPSDFNAAMTRPPYHSPRIGTLATMTRDVTEAQHEHPERTQRTRRIASVG